MRKADLVRKNMVQSVKNERNILAMANNPFVVSWAGEAWARLGQTVAVMPAATGSAGACVQLRQLSAGRRQCACGLLPCLSLDSVPAAPYPAYPGPPR